MRPNDPRDYAMEKGMNFYLLNKINDYSNLVIILNVIN